MAFVGFDPLKTHRRQFTQVASFCVALLTASMIAFARHGA